MHEAEAEKLKVVVNKMAENELKLADLYGACARRYENRDFWEDIEGDERVHNQWVLTLVPGVDRGDIEFRPDRFKPEALETFGQHLDKVISEIGNTNLSQILGLALDIENSMIEKEYFTIYDGDKEEVKHILSDLRSETIHHRDEVEAEMQKYSHVA